MAPSELPATATATAWAWALVVFLLGAGCAHTTPLDQSRQLASETGHFTLRLAQGDEQAASQVQLAAERAGTHLVVWGRLQEEVQLMVMPNHQSLEQAVDRPGYGWLRAWARYREVFVQSPRTWGAQGAEQAQVDELLTHELTHCLMYQLSGGDTDWAYKGIPLWFREGMASYTAQQGYRRGTLEMLAAFLHTHAEDPISDAESLYREQNEVVYSAAHWAFTYLVQRFGTGGVRDLLKAMKGGLSFDAAFAQALGQNRRDFEREFLAHVRLHEPPPSAPAVSQATR
jgi:hypothetical protein